MCRQVNVLGPDKTLVVTINNVPGATAYNVYAQPPGGSTCAGPFGLARVSSIPNPNWATETQASLGTAGPATFNSDDLPSSWAPDATAAPDVPPVVSAVRGDGALQRQRRPPQRQPGTRRQPRRGSGQ